MRCPKCHTETPPEALSCPGCKLTTPRGKAFAVADKEKKQKTAAKTSGLRAKKASSGGLPPLNLKGVNWRGMMPAGGRWITWLVVVVMLGGGGYFGYKYVYSTPQTIDPKVAMNAMNQLKQLPSKVEGKTIDDALSAALKESKAAGELVKFQGWTVKPYNNSSYLVSFSYEEKTGPKSAEWVVSPTSNSFTPISELATSVHR